MSNETGEGNMSNISDDGSQVNRTSDTVEKRLTRTYADLLGIEPDSNLVHVVAGLHHLHNANKVPAELYAMRPWIQGSDGGAYDTPSPSIVHRAPLHTRFTRQVLEGMPHIQQSHRAVSSHGLSTQQSRAWPRFGMALSRFGRVGMAVGGVTLLLGMSFSLTALLKGQSAVRLAAGTPTPGSTQIASQTPSGSLPVLDATTTLSQTIDGYTVTIGPRPQNARAADATTVFVPYAVTNWQGRGYTESAARLVDSQGQGGPRLLANAQQPLTWLGTTRGFPRPLTPGGNGNRMNGYTALVFDASDLQPGQAEHVLELTVNLRISDIYPRLPGVDQNTPQLPRSGTAVVNNISAGPFVFRFRLPFEQLHSVADVHQTVSAGGVPVTLERIVASAEEARVFLTFASPDGKGQATEWQPADVLLSGHGIERVTVSALSSSLRADPGGEYGGQINGWLNARTWAGSALQFAGSQDFLDGGKWTLVVGALVTDKGWVGRVNGPWVFQFTMPPFTPKPTPSANVTYAPTIPAPTSQPPPEVSHEPFPTVPLPGPVEMTEAISSPAIQSPRPTTTQPRPQPPLPIGTAQAGETVRAAYPTVLAGASLTRTAVPTPRGTSDKPLRLSNLQRLVLHPGLDAEGLNEINPPVLSPHGDALLVSTRDHRLLLAALDGSPPVKLTEDVTQYTWSRDGRYIVYAHMEVPNYVQVPYSVTRDGQTRHKLDFESNNIGSLPDVGSDTTWEVRRIQRRGLWRVPLDGGQAEFIVSMPDVTSGVVRVSPDGKRMAYLCVGGVCLQDMDGSNWTKLQTQPYKVIWSRDGSMLAVLTMHDLLIYSADGTMRGSSQYAMMPAQGIPSITQEELTLEWTADSRFLLTYIGNIARYGRQSLIEIDTRTGYAWGDLAPDWARSFSITPDGKRLILRGSAAEFWIANLAP